MDENTSPPDVEGAAAGNAESRNDLFVNKPDDVPTVYADAVLLAAVAGGVVRIQFVEQVGRGEDEDPARVVRHVLNVAMPVASLRSTTDYLMLTATRLKEAGK